jgi:hypothetical protein
MHRREKEMEIDGPSDSTITITNNIDLLDGGTLFQEVSEGFLGDSEGEIAEIDGGEVGSSESLCLRVGGHGLVLLGVAGVFVESERGG